MLPDSVQLQDRWRNIEELYDKNGPTEEDIHLEMNTEDDARGPPILYCKCEAVLTE